MSRHDDLTRVLTAGVVAIVRNPDSSAIVEVSEALVEGGIDVLEITLTVPNALEVIAAVKRRVGDRTLIGAGTVLDPETARSAILAGAEFIVSPVVNFDVIKLCHRYDKLVMPGAFTPTEILTAWDAGADVIKLFPAEVVGPAYLKALGGPLPQVRCLPTGGVNLETIHRWLEAGAAAVGLGSSLVEPAAVKARDMQRLSWLANEYVAKVREFRAPFQNQ